MLRGQHHIPPFPIWGTLLLPLLTISLLAGCGDKRQQAAQEATIAQSALAANDLSTARKAITAAIADRDDVPDYHILRGRIELARGSPSAAFNAYSNALALDATNTEALLGVAQLGLTTGNLPASLDATQRLLDLDPDQPDALLIRGVHSMIKRSYAEAIAYADKVLAVSPGNEGGAVLKARAMFMQHKPQEALAALDTVTDKRSQATAMTRLEIFRSQRQAAKMLPLFKELRSWRPDDRALRLDEANLRFKLGDRTGARNLLSEVLLNPQTDRQSAEQAVALWQEYGTESLSADIVRAVSRGGSVAARTVLARFLIDQGRAGDAAIALSGLSPAATGGLAARLMLLKGDVENARNAAADILGRDKTDCDALDAAAGSAIKLRQFDDALRAAQQASSECPSAPSGWLLSAQAYEALGRDSGVRRVFGQALDANKQSSVLAGTFARWLVSRHQNREALAVARRLTENAPALLSGWRLYLGLCRTAGDSCVAEAAQGLANAQTLLGVDLPPGEPPPNGLLGRFVEQ